MFLLSRHKNMYQLITNIISSSDEGNGKIYYKNLQITDFAKLTAYDLKVTSGLNLVTCIF
jgi:hypothetical protein